jgi:hypothetical protein
MVGANKQPVNCRPPNYTQHNPPTCTGLFGRGATMLKVWCCSSISSKPIPYCPHPDDDGFDEYWYCTSLAMHGAPRQHFQSIYRACACQACWRKPTTVYHTSSVLQMTPSCLTPGIANPSCRDVYDACPPACCRTLSALEKPARRGGKNKRTGAGGIVAWLCVCL